MEKSVDSGKRKETGRVEDSCRKWKVEEEFSRGFWSVGKLGFQNFGN